MRIIASIIVGLLLISALGSALRAQTPAQDPVIRLRTNLVEIDAVVTDAEGRPVTGLRAEDFEIVDKDRLHPLEYCSYISLTESRDLKSLADAQMARSELRRSFVFIVSIPVYDLGISIANRDATFIYSASNRRSASMDAESAGALLRRFIREQMGPRDMAAIVSAQRNQGLLGRLTSDRALLAAAVANLEKHALASSTSITMTQGAIGREFVKQNLSLLDMLSDAIAQMKRLPGRKLVVLVSRGFFIDPRFSETRAIRDRLRILTQEANRAQIAIYTLNPRGLGLGGGGLQDHDSLVSLARETGGTAIYNTNDLAIGFDEVLRENAGYYLLGYDPGEDVTAAPREVKVRVKRPGLRVRARSAAYHRDAPGQMLYGDTGTRLEEALNTPFALRQIGLRLQPLFISPDGKSARLLSVLNIDPAGLTAEAQADGSQKLHLELAYRITGPGGETVKQEARSYTLTLSAADYERARRDGLPYNFDLDLDLPGYYQVAAAVLDRAPNSALDIASLRVGNASRFVYVPDLQKRELSASSLILSAPDETDAKDAQAETGRPARLLRQRFRSRETLRYRAYLYGLRAVNEERPKLQIQAIIRRGKTVTASTAPRLARPEATAVSAIGGDLALTGLAPGVYALELIITDLGRRDAPLSITAEFEIEAR